MVLQTELQTFRRELPLLLLRYPGKYALVHGETVHSIWDSHDDAIQAGFQNFGTTPFLAKKIEEKELPVYCFGIMVPPCQ